MKIYRLKKIYKFITENKIKYFYVFLGTIPYTPKVKTNSSNNIWI